MVPAILVVLSLIALGYYVTSQIGTNEIPSDQGISPDSTSFDDTTGSYALRSYTYKIVNIYPHDQGAFTQGLAFADGILYEGTGGVGISTLRKVDLETGKVIQQQRLPNNFFGEGVTVYKDHVMQLTYLSKIGFVYDKQRFTVLQRFNYPTEGWGLTHDGTHLIMSDGTATLYLLDPETFENRGKIAVYDDNGPVPFLNELEYVKGYIYANVWQSDDIAIISPETGQVEGYIHLQGLIDPASIQEPIDVLNGIAYDSKKDRLFVTGKLWPELFEIELVPLK
ncbi:MAG: glutaminyl-peptide cyclotransferase [Gemmatimonadota bacterium]|nr:MAG: glutaminyl-peptide cyclotransferase [Gemmatimonadota bacterium]